MNTNFSINTTTQTWTVPASLHWRLYKRYFFCQRGTQSIYNCCQFVFSGSKMYLGNFRYFFFFWLSKFLSKATVYAPMCTTTSQILIVICCVYLHWSIMHTHMWRIPFLILSFLDLIPKIKTEPGNVRFPRQTWLSCFCCASGPSSRPTSWSAVSTTNVMHRWKIMIEFHSPSHFTLTLTTQ